MTRVWYVEVIRMMVVIANLLLLVRPLDLLVYLLLVLLVNSNLTI